MLVGVHDCDDGGARLDAGDVRGARATHSQKDVGAGRRGGGVLGDQGARLAIGLVRNGGSAPGAGLDHDFGAERG